MSRVLPRVFSAALRSLRHAHSAESYVPEAYRGVRITTAHVDRDRGLLDVEWSDGAKGAFSFPWLRDNAPEEHSYTLSEHNKARSFLLRNLDPYFTPTGVRVEDKGVEDVVRLIWEEGREARYKATWLRARNHSDRQLRIKRTEELYTMVEYESWPSEEEHKKVDWTAMMRTEDGMLDAAERLLRLGFIHVVNMDPGPGRLKELSMQLGDFHNTHYGSVFTVVPEAKPSNLAYTVKALGLHTDQPYNSEPPQVQALHCVAQSELGGENTFADGFRVAEALKAEKPEVYKLLCETKLEYMDWGIERGQRHQLAMARPVLQLRDDRRLDAVFYNNQVRGWFIDAPPEKHRDVYAAMRAFDDYCYQPRHKVTMKLKAGEMVVFGNNRVLHGREATGPDRHYEGCYFNFDGFRSRIRVAREGRGLSEFASY